jgi:predicted DNA-binding transcriptional regulator AlpA
MQQQDGQPPQPPRAKLARSRRGVSERALLGECANPRPILPNALTPNSVLRPPIAVPYVGLKPQTLAKMRVLGGGPRYVAIGARSVGYRVCDLDDWISQRVRTSTSDPGQSID